MSNRAAKSVGDLIAEISPLFIGISMMAVEFERAVRMTRVLRQHNASIPVVWGGIHPTLAPESCLEHADFVCRGEGELFILDFARALANGETPGDIGSLCFRRNGHVVENPLYPLMPDLTAIPACEYVSQNGHVLHNDTITPLNTKTFRTYARYGGTTYSIMSSRGCPFSCTYCCNNALAKLYGSKSIRFREMSRVIDELREAVARYPFIEYINFQDDCFLARSDEQTEQFCHLYKSQVNHPFIVRSIPKFITEDKIAALKSAGLAWISLGLQSGSDRVCREVYKRRSDKQDFLRAARAIKQQDLAAFYDVILDNPFEGDDDIMETALTLIETPKPFYVQFFSLSFFPGTELRERAIDEKLIQGDEYQTKDYLLYRKTPLNNLVRLAAFLPSRWTKYLVALYRKNPASLWCSINMLVARLFVITVMEPLTYLMVIRLSQQKNMLRTLWVLPNYFSEGLSRFWKQFK
jgi:anaerobic magnesium-protoporphyrin IX monomethyl ester cyclase